MATAADSNPLGAIIAAVKAAVASGQPLSVSLSDILAVSNLPTLAVVPAVVDFAPGDDPIKDLGLYRLAALFPGLPLAQWLPRDGLLSPLTSDNSLVAVDQMGFQVQKGRKGAADELVGISVGVALGPQRSGFKVDALAALNISATLQRLDISVHAPFDAPLVSVALSGSLDFGKLVLDVTLDCPSLTFTAEQPPFNNPSFADLLSAFSLPAPQSFTTLLLTDLQLTVVSREESVEFQATVISDTPFKILGDVLALDSLMIAIEHAPGTTAATITARLTVEKLLLGAVLTNDATGWSAVAGLDLPATLANLGHPDATSLAFSDLLGAVGLSLPDDVAAFLASIAITALDGGVTIPPGDGATTYQLHVAFTTNWTLFGVPFLTATDVKLGTGGNSIVGTVNIDGFEIDLEYDFPSGGPPGGSTKFAASAPQLGNLTGQYDISQGTFTLKTESSTTIGDLLADFVSIFTGNSYTTLPEPWDLLNDFSLSGFQLKITFRKDGTTLLEIHYTGLDKKFLGCEVTGFGLTYDSAFAKAKTGSGFGFTVDGNFPMLDTPSGPSWDPTQPSQAPTAAGIGAAYVDVVLAAFGQHIALPTQPTTVEDALAGILTIIDDVGKGQPLPFNKDAGWLIGARMILLGQIDARLIFADPQIYGVHILVRDDLKIKGAPKSNYLKDLVGLSAEILYRKVSPTIGCYQGFLTLPDKIRKIDMDAFSVQLPSLGIEVFTNGDFQIDIGYPHNGDFSHSCIITAAEYYGAGGLLFGKLSGATADNLPAIVTDQNGPVGAFGNVIEIGLGFQVGIYRGFSAGPMSASLSVLLQGIFQGTFAKFTTNPVGGQQSSEEYYSVYASVTIIGKLEGEIDFVIVTASLLVEITLSAAIEAVCRSEVLVPMSASVDVELTVSINCGLFSIHIHVGFSTTVSYTAKFGQDTWPTTWWIRPPPNAPMLRAPVRLGARPQAAPTDIQYAALQCGPLALDLYIVPQLTLGLRPDASQADWIYVVQTALMSPGTPTRAGVKLFAAGETSQSDQAVELITAWLLQAYQVFTRPGVTPASGATPDELYAKITVLPTDLDGLTTYLHSVGQAGSTARWPTAAETQAFFGANLRLTVGALPQTSGANYGLAFFPLVPNSIITADHATVGPADAAKVGEVLDAFLRIIVLAALHVARQTLGTNSSMLLSDVYAAMEQSAAGAPTPMSSVVGNGTRFMLHGTRVASQGTPAVPPALYRATGQEAIVADFAPTSLTVTCNNSSAAAWGLVLPNGGASAPVNIPPSQIPRSVTRVDDDHAVATAMSLAGTGPRHFNLSQGQAGTLLSPAQGTIYVRNFPPALLGVIATPAAAGYSFGLQMLVDQTVTDVAPADYAWCATIAFTVRRVPKASSTATKPTYLPNVYELVGVQSDDLRVLESIYNGRAANPPTALEIAHVETDSNTRASALYIQPVAGTSIFIFRSNVSTQTNPPSMLLRAARPAAVAADPAVITFIEHLMTGGLTNSGGYYLNYGAPTPLKDSQFDVDGLAHLQLVVSLTPQPAMPPATGVVLDGAVNAVRVTDGTVGPARHVFVDTPALQVTRATVPVGTIGMRMTRPAPPTPNGHYQDTIDNLFHLLAFVPGAVVTAGGQQVPITNPPKDQYVTGPLRDEAAKAQGLIAYQRLFDLLALTGTAWPSDPPDLNQPAPPIDTATLLARNPYAFVGGKLPVGFQWVDLYGNTLPSSRTAVPIPVDYTDPVAGLGDWPHLTYGYAIEQAGNGPRVFAIKRAFQWDDSQDTRRVNNLKRAYATIYHQLADIDVAVTASFLTSPLTVLIGNKSITDQLRADIASILHQIDGTAQKPLGDLTFELPDDPGKYRADVLFQLSASATFTRRGPVDPNFAGEPSIRAMTTALSPYAPTQPGDKSATQTYQAFATAFEATLAMTEMKVLVGDADAPSAAQLWIMRCGANSISFSFDQPAAFAPLPLAYQPPVVANTLMSREPVGVDRINQKIMAESATNVFVLTGPLTATNVDLDAAMADFLRKLETFLAPDCAIPAILNDSGKSNAVDRCIAVKRALAAKLSSRVVSLADGKTPSQAASDTYSQACLISLSNFYDIDSVAQVNVTATIAGAEWPSNLPLNLYGRAIDLSPTPPQANNNVTIAPGKVKFGHNAPLALALRAHRKGEEATFPLPPTLQMEAFEKVSGSIQVPDGEFTTGTWLRFVLTDDSRRPFADNEIALPLHPYLISLPLRAYPPSPIITAQDFKSADPPPKTAAQIDPNPLAAADEWSLDLTYRHVYVAQDTLNVSVTINLGEKGPRPLMASDPPDDILDTLTQFAALYTQAGPNQSGVGPVFDSLRTGTQSPQLGDALVAFAVMAEYLLASLDANIKPPKKMLAARSAGDGDGGYTFKFELREGFDPTAPAPAPWMLNVVADPTNPKMGDWTCPMPIVSLVADGVLYKASPDANGNATFLVNGIGAPLAADTAMAVVERSLQVEPFSIIDHHNGTYRIAISRNAGSLVVEHGTASVTPSLPDGFVYRTPAVQAPDKVLPFIDKPVSISIRDLPRPGSPPPATTLTDALDRLYVNLLTGITNINSDAQGSVQTVVTLSYPVQDGTNPLGLPDRSLPVLLDLPENVPFYPTPADLKDLVAGIRAALIGWRNDMRLSADLLARSQLQFEVSVFSTISETGIPLIHHSGLYLGCDTVSWE